MGKDSRKPRSKKSRTERKDEEPEVKSDDTTIISAEEQGVKPDDKMDVSAEEQAKTDITTVEVDEETESFEELGLEQRLLHALLKKSIEKPTPIQRVAIPLILEGKDVVAKAKTGSGKTLAYLLPLLHKLLTDSISSKNAAPSTIILVPTRELCQQVYAEVTSLIELCRVQLKVVQLTSTMSVSDMKASLAGSPDIVISTPACVQSCLSKGIIQAKALQESLSTLVLDEADLLLSYGYEDDLKALTSHVPKRCQCLLMSATSSADVDKLKTLVLHNPHILTLPEVELKDDIVPRSVQQSYISCDARDKLLYTLALLKLDLVQKKVLIFTNSIDMSFRLKLFLEQFGIKSAVLNAELPQNSRQHIIEAFGAGLFDYLIATDDNQSTEEKDDKESRSIKKRSKKHPKRKLDAEFGVVRGIDFKNVYTVLNVEMPLTAEGYVHRIGRTGRAYNTGASVSLVSPEELDVFEEIKCLIGEDDSEELKYIAPFRLLGKDAVEALRYRAEDVGRSITKIAVRESRAQDLRNEILNSEKLKAHFKENPRDLDLLKHDKSLSKKAPARHLRDVPDYLLDPATQEASKMVQLTRAAMGINGSKPRKGPKGLKRKLKRSKDPLKTFSAEASKHGKRAGSKRKGDDR